MSAPPALEDSMRRRRLIDAPGRPLNFTVRRQTVTPREFQDQMAALLDSLCARRALDPLRVLLPHWPMHMGLTDEWTELAAALKTTRVQHRDRLSEEEMELVISLQHAAEAALERR